MTKRKLATDDPAVVKLAELLGINRHAALGVRSILWELSLDFVRSPDLTAVPVSQWALMFSVPKADIPDLIQALIEADLLIRRGNRLLLAHWRKASADESHAAFRKWLRSKPGAITRLAALLSDDDASSE